MVSCILSMVKLNMVLEKPAAKSAMTEVSVKQCLPERDRQMSEQCGNAIGEQGIRSRVGHDDAATSQLLGFRGRPRAFGLGAVPGSASGVATGAADTRLRPRPSCLAMVDRRSE